MSQTAEKHMPVSGTAKISKAYGQNPAPGNEMRIESQAKAPIYATEASGTLVDWEKSPTNPENMTATIEYDYGTEGKVRVTYDNVASLQLPSDGKTYSPGEAIGYVPNSEGVDNSIGLRVEKVHPDGSAVSIDPTAYIHDLRQAGAMDNLALIDENGKDVLTALDKGHEDAATVTAEDINEIGKSENQSTLRTPEEWAEWLSKQQQTTSQGQTEGQSMAGGDIFTSIIAAIVRLMFALKTMENGKDKEDKNKQESQAMMNGKEYGIPMEQGHTAKIFFDPATRQATLRYNLGEGEKTVVLGELHIANMTAVIEDTGLTNEQKSQKLDGMVKQIDAVAMARAMQSGQNFEISLDQAQSMQQSR